MEALTTTCPLRLSSKGLSQSAGIPITYTAKDGLPKSSAIVKEMESSTSYRAVFRNLLGHRNLLPCTRCATGPSRTVLSSVTAEGAWSSWLSSRLNSWQRPPVAVTSAGTRDDFAGPDPGTKWTRRTDADLPAGDEWRKRKPATRLSAETELAESCDATWSHANVDADGQNC